MPAHPGSRRARRRRPWSPFPTLEVDPESYEVRADGELLRCEPAERLPLTQRYCLF